MQKLKKLVAKLAEDRGIAQHHVLADGEVQTLVTCVPLTNEELKQMDKWGKQRLKDYGKEVLECIQEFIETNNVKLAGTFKPDVNDSAGDEIDDMDEEHFNGDQGCGFNFEDDEDFEDESTNGNLGGFNMNGGFEYDVQEFDDD